MPKALAALAAGQGADAAQAFAALAALEGDWLAFRLPDHEAHCGLICWQGAPFDTVVLFNNAWSYAIALSPALLEQQLRSGEARIVSNDALFDEAAQRALGQLRP